MKAVCVCPPISTKFCACVATPLDEFEIVGDSPVKVKPASAMGLLPVAALSDTVSVEELFETLRIAFEYVAALCHVLLLLVVFVGHIPPKMYEVHDSSAAPTRVENEKPEAKNLAPALDEDRDDDRAVVDCVHVPLEPDGFQVHTDPVELHDPVYTSIFPEYDIVGTYAVSEVTSSLKGTLELSVVVAKSDVSRLSVTLTDRSCACVEVLDNG